MSYLKIHLLLGTLMSMVAPVIARSTPQVLVGTWTSKSAAVLTGTVSSNFILLSARKLTRLELLRPSRRLLHRALTPGHLILLRRRTLRVRSLHHDPQPYHTPLHLSRPPVPARHIHYSSKQQHTPHTLLERRSHADKQTMQKQVQPVRALFTRGTGG